MEPLREFDFSLVRFSPCQFFPVILRGNGVRLISKQGFVVGLQLFVRVFPIPEIGIFRERGKIFDQGGSSFREAENFFRLQEAYRQGNASFGHVIQIEGNQSHHAVEGPFESLPFVGVVKCRSDLHDAIRSIRKNRMYRFLGKCLLFGSSFQYLAQKRSGIVGNDFFHNGLRIR